VKGESNILIAGSLLNALKCSRSTIRYPGRALIEEGGVKTYQLQSNCEWDIRFDLVGQRQISAVVERETAQTTS